MMRGSCGSLAGALAHQEAGEFLCGFCAYAEQARRIAAEGIARRVPPPPEKRLGPVSAADAEAHRAVLARETAEFDRAHPGWKPRSGDRYDGLRAVAS